MVYIIAYREQGRDLVFIMYATKKHHMGNMGKKKCNDGNLFQWPLVRAVGEVLLMKIKL